ncbi:hypothetical protein Q8A67_020596 [Cirrhinus molitorella]|uniref:Uncharacterized protein n=1 Tax=Cirrhinus molitorella TaxID=172907 RepID=A0AA88TFI6_9TELE|nr:hypothetical protein Q8A67_020596 [Cirrhinus molitorella]
MLAAKTEGEQRTPRGVIFILEHECLSQEQVSYLHPICTRKSHWHVLLRIHCAFHSINCGAAFPSDFKSVPRRLTELEIVTNEMSL